MQGSQHENSCKMAQHSKNTSSVKQLSKQLHVTNNLHHSNIFHFFFKCLSYFFYLVGANHPHLVAYQFSAWENHGHFEVQTRMPCVPNLNQQQPKLHISPGIWLPFEKNNQAFEAVSFQRIILTSSIYIYTFVVASFFVAVVDVYAYETK